MFTFLWITCFSMFLLIIRVLVFSLLWNEFHTSLYLPNHLTFGFPFVVCHMGIFNLYVVRLLHLYLLPNDLSLFINKYVIFDFLILQILCVCVFVSRLVMLDSLWPRGLSSLAGSSVCEILQARILEWVAISFSIIGLKTVTSPHSHCHYSSFLI